MATHSSILASKIPWTEEPGSCKDSDVTEWQCVHTHTHISCIYCKKKAPFQGPRVGSRLTLRNELSEETQVLTEQEALLGRGAWGEWWG